MNSITEEIKNIVIAKSNEFERLTKGTKDEYNLYNDHIQYVYNYIIKLSKDESVDLEVLELSALLHDISMTNISLDRSRHNIYSSKIAEKLLNKFDYDTNKIKLIKKCILNHSSKRANYRDTIEEELLVTADSLSHFDNINSLYSLAYNTMNLSDKETLVFIKDKLTKDYNEIIPKYKHLVEDKYQKIMNLKTKDELINYLKEGNKMTEYNLRKYNNNDYDFVYNIKKKAYKKYVEECFEKWDEEEQKEFFKKFITQVKDNAYIIQTENKDIGFYNGELIDDDTYEIGNICIIPEYQGLGIGTNILNNILEKYQNKNIKIQYFKQNPVGNLYKKLGFTPNGETKHHFQMKKIKRK